MCALRSQQALAAPEGGEVQDVLVLIDPRCPSASRAAYWSALTSTLVSVTLTRDLFMYSGADQRVALHGLSLMALVGGGEAAAAAPVTEASMRQALHILYSVRSH